MTGPLDGVTVVDLSRALAGPHAGMRLGDLGARVIKVESPGQGDDTRAWGPPFVAGEVPRAQGNHHPAISPYGLFRCADGMLQIAVGSENLWQEFTSAFGLDGNAAGMATNPERVRNREAVIETVGKAFAGWTLAELLPMLADAGIPAGEVRTLDRVYEWEQTRSQGLVIEVDHPQLGSIELPGPALRFDDNVYAGGRPEHLPPSALGQHNDSVQAWLDECDAGPAGRP